MVWFALFKNKQQKTNLKTAFQKVVDMEKKFYVFESQTLLYK